MTEVWKSIPGYVGLYEISDMGNVRSYNNSRTKKDGVPRLLAASFTATGYKKVRLDGKTHLVHRLVMLAFVGPSELEVNHRNGARHDNRLLNLEYTTRRGNVQHSYSALGRRQNVGEDNAKAKLSEEDVAEIRDRYLMGERTIILAREFGVRSASALADAISGKTWQHLPGAVRMHKNPAKRYVRINRSTYDRMMGDDDERQN